MRRLALVVVLALLSGVTPATAQETRQQVLEQEKAAKAAAVRPYEPDKAEKIFDWAMDSFLLAPEGFLPLVTSMPKGDNVFHGGGIALGAMYRGFLGDRAGWSASGLVSIPGYTHVDVTVDALQLARGRVALRGGAGWTSGGRIPFYGVGAGSSQDNLTNFGVEMGYVGAQLRATPLPWFVLEGSAAIEDFTTKSGSGSQPSIETVFTFPAVPGLLSAPRYVHSTASAGIDWRPVAGFAKRGRPVVGYARSGGLYQVTYHDYRDADETYSFSRVDAEVVQHIPILRENWVVSLRGLVQTTLDDADVVPHFLLPMLGSGDTLRAFGTARFHDRHSMLMQAEWRWIPNRSFMDMALFYDAGKVAADRSALDFDGLEHDFGVGLRFHGPLTTPLRIDLAKGREGFRIVWGGSAVF
jgi:hypothetical protein